MSSRRSAPLRRWLLPLLLAAGLAGATQADFRDAYRAGQEALERRDWAEAARQMRLAIGERPDEAAGVLSLRRYTPHYFLGVALHELGDCRNAIESLATSERQGKLSRDEGRDLARRRDECQRRITRTEEALVAAQREIDAAAAAAFALAKIESAPVMRSVWAEGDPSFAARQQPATARLAQARAALSRGERALDAEQVAEAGRMAQEARDQLEQLAGEAGARRDELQSKVERELSEMANAAAAARRDLDFANRSLAPLPPELARRTRALQEALADSGRASASTPLPELQRLQDQLRRAVRELRAALRPPPDELQEAARAYLAGDFEAVLVRLDRASFRDPRAAAHACLLRAATLFSLAQLSGDEQAGIAASRAELQRCRTLPIQVRVVEHAFPPAFRALHQEVAIEAAVPAP